MRTVQGISVVILVFGLTVAPGAQEVRFGGSDWSNSIEDFETLYALLLTTEDSIDEADADFGNLVGTGFGASFVLEIDVGPNLAIQPQVAYRHHVGGLEGDADFEGEVNGQQITGAQELELSASADLLSLPVYLKPRAGAGPGYLYALLGPEISLVTGDMEFETEVTTENVTTGLSQTETETDTEQPDNRLLFGGGVGAGYSIPVGAAELFFDAVFSTTFNSPLDEALLETDDGFLLRHVSIGAGVTSSF